MIDLQWFAAEDEGRTEKPSEQKLRRAREEGRVAKSQDLSGAVVALFVTAVFVLLAPWFYEKLRAMFVFYLSRAASDDITNRRLFRMFVTTLLQVVLPLAAAGIATGVIVNIAQNRGFIFTTKTIRPNFSRIAPRFAAYFKRTLLSPLGLFNVAKTIVKAALVAVLAFFLIRRDLGTTLSFLRERNVESALVQTARMVSRLLLSSAVVLTVIGVIDYVMQRREFTEQMKMTRREVREEIRESEGDADVRRRLEAAQKDLLSRNVAAAVRESDVVIADAGRFAVALKWRRFVQDSPAVNAKGADAAAQAICRIARGGGVPVIEDRALARLIFTDADTSAPIPRSTLRGVAAVYARIGFLNRQER